MNYDISNKRQHNDRSTSNNFYNNLFLSPIIDKIGKKINKLIFPNN
jgi:hypothetical protein